MGISLVGIVRVGVILDGNFPDGNCSDGSYPGWEFSLVRVLRVGIVRWESSGWILAFLHFCIFTVVKLNFPMF